MKKKGNSLADLGGMVYSTNQEASFDNPEDSLEDELKPSEQYLEAHIEKKGRGGKVAVLVKGYEGSETQLKELAKELKSHCATGGSAKNGEILIQGDVRDKVMSFLKDKGYNVKRVGG